MRKYLETPTWFEVEAEQLLGILTEPTDSVGNIGVLIVVGGPQYRVGSHRQFTLLARQLASHGYPSLRFDFRGMGDSTGEPRSFTEVAADIVAARQILTAQASVAKVVLWGMCDAASAALLQTAESINAYSGLVLVNPWVRSDTTFARARLKHYYAARLFDLDLWKKIFAGQIDWVASTRSLADSALAQARGTLTGASSTPADSFQTRMASGIRSFRGEILLALSGRDITAKEFSARAASDPAWQGLLERSSITHVFNEHADHTFSRPEWTLWLEERTLDWLSRLAQSSTGFAATS